VGGGPAGSTAAKLLAERHEVLILEEHTSPGQPMQCAGLVTERGVPSFARDSVIARIRGARLHSPLGFTLSLEARASRACVIDRARFDRVLFNAAVDEGAVPLLGARVTSVLDRQSGPAVRANHEGKLIEVLASVVVGADGYKSLSRRAARLRPPRHMLTGLQVDLKGVDADPDFVDLFFGSKIAPGFFAWAIPAGDHTRVGLCTWASDHTPAVYLQKLLRGPEFAKCKRISIASGKIPVGTGRSAVGGNIMLVGDAACHAKPLSGGGIYTGVTGAQLCARVADSYLEDPGSTPLSEYDALWKDAFGRELSRAFRVRKVFLALNDKKLDKALRMFNDPAVKELLEGRGDIDYPASLSKAVLKLAPKLAQFSPQVIESLL